MKTDHNGILKAANELLRVSVTRLQDVISLRQHLNTKIKMAPPSELFDGFRDKEITRLHQENQLVTKFLTCETTNK